MKFIILSLLFSLLTQIGLAKTYRYFQKASRFPYEVKLFHMAVEKIDPHIVLKENQGTINYGRGMHFLEQGKIDFAFFATNDGLESRFLPVKIPILNGILGYRLNLIHKDTQAAFKNVKTLQELTSQFMAGFNHHWPDKSVLIENKMPTVFSSNYKSLFKMLNVKRFHYFPRGINEVWKEQETHVTRAPNIIVDSHLAFFYPYPVYFFVNKDNTELAETIERGLNMILADGSFKQWFIAYHKPYLDRAKITSRTLIPLVNPDLPTGFDLDNFDTSWWRTTQ